MDLSRVDSMIAVRMRVTGHDQAADPGKYRQQWEKLEGREKAQKIERDNTLGMRL